MAGRVIKKEADGRLTVTQSMWVDSTTLSIDREKCISCDMCRNVCPKEAITLAPPGEGALPVLDIDETLCTLCGLCAVFCPVGAAKLVAKNTWRETEEEVQPIIAVGGVPHFSKGIELDITRCPEGCDRCVDACPRQAMSMGEEGVTLDRSLCLSCAHCQAACPVEGAIVVERLFDGGVEVTLEKCPEGCDACASACPTLCFSPLPERGVEVVSRDCICCGACLVACTYGAIDLTRLRLRTEGEGYSAVWSRAVDRLLSGNARFLEQNERNYVRLTELLRESRL